MKTQRLFPRRFQRRHAVGVAVALGAMLADGTAVPSTARADGTVTIDAGIRASILHVVAPSAGGPPRVRIVDAAGFERLRSAAEPTVPPDGRWAIPLGNLIDPIIDPPLLLEAGDRIEATVDGSLIVLTMPDVFATADPDDDSVRGRVPPGFSNATLHIAQDPELYDSAPTTAAIEVTPDSDGTFDVPLGERLDVGPGTSGELVIRSPEGHVVRAAFAVPVVRVGMVPHTVIQAQVDAGSRQVELAILTNDGAELARSPRAVAVGGGRFDFEVTDEQLPWIALLGTADAVLRMDLLVDGRVVASDPVHLLTAGVDRDAGAVRGAALPGSRIAVWWGGSTARGIAGPDGTYRVPMPVAARPTAMVVSWSGGALVRRVVGYEELLNIALWGDEIWGRSAFPGLVTVEHRSAEGGPVARRSAAIGEWGHFALHTADVGGMARPIMPGDAITVTFADDQRLALAMPDLALRVDDAGGRLTGTAAPGAAVRVHLFRDGYRPPYAANYLSTSPFMFHPDATLEAVADAEGTYAVRCVEAWCAPGAAIVDADIGQNAWATLAWYASPVHELDASRGVFTTYATAGTAIEVTPWRDGTAIGPARVVRTSTRGSDRSTSAVVDLRDAFEAPLPVGTGVHVMLGGEESTLVAPTRRWHVDLERVTGVCPRCASVFAGVFDPTREGDNGFGSVEHPNQAGYWRVDHSAVGWDLRAGDQVDVSYRLDASRVVAWSETVSEDPAAALDGAWWVFVPLAER